MANVTGESAAKVSEQMTAVWNNFYDGSKSLEYYTDVMTALGAATASSTDEISQGIEKFAAIGKTVGLSYEYATAALATVTAKTRQSADVVGNAFKTIFSRLEQLKLGETLDDGTSLGQYSKALATVGVNIKDTNGQLKDMDTILDETAAKWTQLDRSQQVALAQSVAGIRQYSQFIALMSNWDFMEQNLEVVENSTGTLQKQADIYAESWDAAKVRVKAAAEEIYQDLLDDKFFIKLTDGFAKFLSMIQKIGEGLGGVPGILATIGNSIMMIAGPKIAGALANTMQSIFMMSKSGQQLQLNQKTEALNLIGEQRDNASSSSATASGYDILYKASEKYYNYRRENEQLLSEEQKKRLDEEYNIISANAEEIALLEKKLEKEKALTENSIRVLSRQASTRESNDTGYFVQQAQASITTYSNSVDNTDFSNYTNNNRWNALTSSIDALGLGGLNPEIITCIENLEQLGAGTDDFKGEEQEAKDAVTALQAALAKTGPVTKTASQQFNTLLKSFQSVSGESRILETATKTLTKSVGSTQELQQAKTKFEEYTDILQKAGISSDALPQSLKDIQAALDSGDINAYNTAMKNLEQQSSSSDVVLANLETGIRTLGGQLELTPEQIDNVLNKIQEGDADTAKIIENLFKMKNGLSELGTSADQAKMGFTQLAQGISGLASGLMGVTQLINGIKGLGNIWNDEDATIGEKILSTLTSMGSILMSVTMIMRVFQNQQLSNLVTGALNIKAVKAEQALKAKGIILTGTETLAIKLKKAAEAGEIKGIWAKIAAKWTEKTANEAVIATELMSLGIIGLIIAAVAALIAIIYILVKAIDNAYNADAIAAERAKKAAEELSKAYEDTKQAAEDLKSTFDGYNDVVNALNECTKGTQEWRDALEEANQQAIDLLDKYPDLLNQQGAVTRNADGLLVIDENAQKRAIEEAEQNVRNAYAAKLNGQVRAEKAQIKSDTTDLRRKIGNDKDIGSTIYATDITNNIDKLAGKTEEEFVQTLQKIIVRPATMATEQYNSMIQSMTKYRKEIDNLSTASKKLATQERNQARLVVSQNLEGDYDAATQEVAAAKYQAAVKQYTNDSIKENTDKFSKATGKNAEVEAYWQKYLDATGLNLKLDDNAVRGNNENRTFAYIDPEDASKVKEVTLEEMAAAIGAAEALKELGNNANAAAKQLSDIKTNYGDAIYNAAIDFIANGNFANSSRKDINAFLSNAIHGTSQGETVDFKLLGFNTLDEALEAYNVETAYELVAKLHEMSQNQQEAIDNAAASHVYTVQTAYANLGEEIRDSVNPQQAKEIGNILGSAFAEGGSEKLAEVQKSIEALGSNAGPIIDLISKNPDMDWKTFSEEAKKAGIDISALSNESFAELERAIRKVEKAITSLADAANRFNDINDVVKDLKNGDLISEEDYQKLEKQSLINDEDWLYDASGKYRFIGNADILREQAYGKSVSGYSELLSSETDFNNNLKDLTDDQIKNVQNYEENTTLANLREDYKDSTQKAAWIDSNAVTDMAAIVNSTATSLSAAELKEINEQLANNSLTYQNYYKLYDAAKEAVDGVTDVDQVMLKNQNDSKKFNQAMGSSAKTLNQLTKATKDYNFSQTDLTEQTKAFIAAKEIEAGITAEEVKQRTGNADMSDKEVALYLQQAAAAKTYATNLKELNEAKESRNNVKIDEANEKLRQNLAQLLNVDREAITDQWMEYNKDEIEGLFDAEGNIVKEKFDALWTSFADRPIELNAGVKLQLKDTDANAALQTFYDTWDGKTITPGVNDEAFIASLNKLAKEANLSTEQINSILSNYGFSADKIETKPAWFIESNDGKLVGPFDKKAGVDLNGGHWINLPIITGLHSDNKTVDSNGLTTDEPKDTKGSTTLDKAKVTSTKDKLATNENEYTEQENRVSKLKDDLSEVQDLLLDDNVYDSENLLKTYLDGVNDITQAYKEQLKILNAEKNILETTIPENVQKLKDNLSALNIDYSSFFDKNGNFTDESGAKKELNDYYNSRLNQMTDEQKTAYEEAINYISTVLSDKKELLDIEKRQVEVNQALAEIYKEEAEVRVKHKLNQEAKEINKLSASADKFEKELSVISKTADKAAKKTESLWGKDRLNAIDEEIEALKNEEAQNRKIAQSYEKLAKYQQQTIESKKEFQDLNIALEIENGVLINQGEVELAINEMIASIEEQIVTAKSVEGEKNKEIIEQLYEQLALYQSLLESINGLSGSLSKMYDAQQSADDALDKIKDKNYQRIIDKLNMQIQVAENEIALLDYDFKVLSSNFYTMAEAAELFLDKGNEYLDMLDMYEQGYSELEGVMDRGMIKQSDYIDGLQQMFDGLLQTMGSIEDLTQEVKGYYGQALSAAQEEIGMYTQALASSTATLNHYKSVLELAGREADYKALDKLYKGISATTRNEFEAAKTEYEMLQQQANIAKEALEAFSDDKTSKGFEILNQKWKDAENAAQQALSNMQSMEEAWFQARRDEYDNFYEYIKQLAERTLTGDLSFDQATSSLERLKNANAEYLTEGNKVYETTKLIREAQKELDKSDNAASKQRLKNFIDETAALKNKTKLSNLELELQKAQYDILIARMALDEAQNSKSKVRLQRNSEGGYGYVYTADQDKISDAQQKYDDAQNALYNLRLEKSSEYADKVFQLEQEGFEKLQELQELYQTGVIATDEEFKQKQAEIIDYYDARILEAKELWTIAMGDANEQAAQDSWTKELEMLQHTDEWRGTMEDYIKETAEAWISFKDEVSEVADIVGMDADSISNKVGEIVKDSDTILQYTKDTVTETGNILTNIQLIVDQFAIWRTQTAEPLLQAARDTAQAIVDSMKQAMDMAGDMDDTLELENRNADALREAGRMVLAGYSEAQINAATQEQFGVIVDSDLLNGMLVSSAKAAETTGSGTEANAAWVAWRGGSADDVAKAIANDEGNTWHCPYCNKNFNSAEAYSNHLKTVHGHSSNAVGIRDYLQGYATGGYTGSWGSEGKIAILHEKELVLNQDDTNNLLAAVDMVREITNLFNLPTFGFTASSYHGEAGSIEQNVHIEASFPNAVDHNEIELAFNDLINQASQYVMKQ